MSFIEKMHASLDSRANDALILEVHGEKLVEFTGRQIKDMVASARGFLASRGVQPGDRVALIGHNSARWAALDLAILGAGAIVVPMYDRQAANELAGMLTNCETNLVLVDTPSLRDTLAAAWPAGSKSIALFDEVLAHAKADIKPVARAGSDRVTMIYTSGTSGEPKGVLYTVDNVNFMLQRTIDGIKTMVGTRTGADRVFHYLPLCFAGSRIQLWSQLARANPLMLSTDLNNLVKELATAQPHYFLNVPTLLERIRVGVSNKLQERGGLAHTIYRHAVEGNERSVRGIATLKDKVAREVAKRIVFPKIREQIGKNLEFLICGSAPLSEETQRWFGLVGIPVYQVYGLTETTAIVTMDQKGLARPGYVGKVIDGVEMRVTDEGELICRGPNIFPEYWKRPDATKTSIREGWFHSGDMAEITGDGYLRIVGRLKDLLVPESGHNVAPGPIEEKLANFVLGAQVMVVDHAKPFLSVIVTGSHTPETVQAAIDQLNHELPHYRRLRKFYIAPEPFSVENGLLTANQKLKRGAVEKRYASEIQGMYE